MLLSGDFRQCLPVIPHSSRAEVVDAAINRSYLWQYFKIMKLGEKMRVKMSNDTEADLFDRFTLKVGNGEAEVVAGTDMVEIPEEMCIGIKPNSKTNPSSEKDAMKSLADHVYPNINENFEKIGWMDGRAILAPTNKQVDQLNNLITDMFPGKPAVLSSSDEVINPDDFQRYNVEYLNTLSTSGLPNHRLFIKPGMPLMLMRNLNPKMGLCNGTRLIFKKMHMKCENAYEV